MTVGELKENLIGMSHAGSLNKVRNFEALLERATNSMLTKIDPVSTIRTAVFATIYDEIYSYAGPSDYKKIIDLLPEDNRNSTDRANRKFAEPFAAEVGITNKSISVEANNGTKVFKVNWRNNNRIVFATAGAVTGQNGTWSAVGTASTPVADPLYHLNNSASLKFTVNASGDGLQNSTLNQIDLSNWTTEADWFEAFYFTDVSKLTSITGIWGDDLTAKYYTSVAQTAQFDGTAFQVGWNIVRFPGLTATQTGTVDWTKMKAYKFTVQATGVIADIRAEQVTVQLGRIFDAKYYSKYVLKSTAGVWLRRTASDDDTFVLDADEINILMFECLKSIAQQQEGEDSTFDLAYANKELHGDPTALDVAGRTGLYGLYRAEYPTQSKKAVTKWGGGPRYRS